MYVTRSSASNATSFSNSCRLSDKNHNFNLNILRVFNKRLSVQTSRRDIKHLEPAGDLVLNSFSWVGDARYLKVTL